MTITARFESTCPRCQNKIPIGTPVHWERGTPAVHVDCPPQVLGRADRALHVPNRIAVENAGVYVMPDGMIVKVKANKSKSGTYAMRWHEINGERLTEAGMRKRGEYEYVFGLVALVAQVGRKMTLEEAQEFILKYGVCARCGRELKAADSVERGIGPVCIQYFGGF